MRELQQMICAHALAAGLVDGGALFADMQDTVYADAELKHLQRQEPD